MAERNQIKKRRCQFCGEYVLGKASKLKKHGTECKQTHKLAAQQALMDKIKEEMLNPRDPAQAMYEQAYNEEAWASVDKEVIDELRK